MNSRGFSSNYLSSVRKEFQYYKQLGEKTFEQLSDQELFWQYNSASNSIAIIVKHLWGNMLSRWTDFLTTDGEKDFRDREAEFESDIDSREELLAKWEAGWAVLFEALDCTRDKDLNQLVYIRNQGHTITEAVNRQLAHYSYHVGQIVYIGRMIKGNNWVNLSIPKGESENFNKQKFDQVKGRGHFTDDI